MREQLQTWSDDLTYRSSRCSPRITLACSSREAVHRAETAAHRLRQSLMHRLDRLSDRLTSRDELLKHIGPEAVLARGFSYTTNAEGRVLKDAAEVNEGDPLITRLAQGTVRSVAK
jgi:exodeoxyribonuclease VII large subunit